MDGVFVVFLPFLMFFLFLFVLARRPPNCPDWGRSLDSVQSFWTVTWRQGFEGGFLCQNCGCETTLAGEKVVPGTGPRTSSVVRGVLHVTVLVGVTAALLTFILSYAGIDPALVPTPQSPVAAPPAVVADLPIAQPVR